MFSDKLGWGHFHMFSDKLEWGHFLDDQQGRFNFGMIVQLSLCKGQKGLFG